MPKLYQSLHFPSTHSLLWCQVSTPYLCTIGNMIPIISWHPYLEAMPWYFATIYPSLAQLYHPIYILASVPCEYALTICHSLSHALFYTFTFFLLFSLSDRLTMYLLFSKTHVSVPVSHTNLSSHSTRSPPPMPSPFSKNLCLPSNLVVLPMLIPCKKYPLHTVKWLVFGKATICKNHAKTYPTCAHTM